VEYLLQLAAFLQLRLLRLQMLLHFLHLNKKEEEEMRRGRGRSGKRIRKDPKTRNAF
jgi:hypothetical protein